MKKMRRRCCLAVMLILILIGGSIRAEAGTIVYSYDEEHRLAGVNYNNQATITYEYDEAHNLTKYEVLTDPAYLKPFLLYFSWLEELLPFLEDGKRSKG